MQQPTPTPSPAVVQVPAPAPARAGVVTVEGASPQQIYVAARQAREELSHQLDRLEDQRQELQSELPSTPSEAKAGVQARIQQVDARITALDKQIADADLAVARAAAIPGAVQPEPPPPLPPVPDEFWVVTVIFMFIVILPLTIAYARRIWRRGAAAVSSLPQEIYDRFNRIDQAIDAVAIEVERVGEGQRFLTRLYNDQQRALGVGPAERVDVSEREKEQQRRG